MSDQSPSPDPGPDWTDQIANRVESTVATVRDKTTVPLTKVARAVVFGLVAAVLGTLALVLLVVAAVRLEVYLPFHPQARRVWVTDVGLGAIFLLVGAFFWRKRTVRHP
ncbi:MAG: hypothetical protein ACYC1D_14795 [Acidimicrobiales bacterium]